jgi:hypothetical protein
MDSLLQELKSEIFATLNCIQIGKIEKVTPGEQTAEISLQVKRRVNGNTISSYPVLVDCPIFILQGGGAYLDMPVSAGDYCLVLFNDRNIDTWWSTANVKEPPNLRKHSLSDGIALVGINPVTAVREMNGQLVRLFGPSGPGSEEFAARQNDAIQSTAVEDATFWAWISAVGTALGITPPTSLTGKISGGSTEVKIG